MQITVLNGQLDAQELEYYVHAVEEQYPKRKLESLELKVCDDGYVEVVGGKFVPVPFQRIRRITGYLVGTLDRFNNAKRAEEHDRIKHNHIQGSI